MKLQPQKVRQAEFDRTDTDTVILQTFARELCQDNAVPSARALTGAENLMSIPPA